MPYNWDNFKPKQSVERTADNNFASSQATICTEIGGNGESWVLKLYQAGHPLPPELEVLAAELYRLFQISSYQPETRLVFGKHAKYVASKKLENFTSIAKMADKSKLTTKYIPGLASILVISLLVGQIDLNSRDNGIIKTSEGKIFVHFDDNNTLYFKSDNTLPSFTERTLDNLPFPSGYPALYWLDIIESIPVFGEYLPEYSKNHEQLNQYKKLWNMRKFQEEKYMTLAKIVLFPDKLLKQFINHYIEDKSQSERLYAVISLNAKKMLALRDKEG